MLLFENSPVKSGTGVYGAKTGTELYHSVCQPALISHSFRREHTMPELITTQFYIPEV
jgi:hypothetical protein